MPSVAVPVIVSAARIPTGRFQGTLAPLAVTDLGALVVREAVRRAQIDASRLDSVIMGNVVSAGAGMAPARQAAIRGGVPPSVPALTINKICGSGLMAVMLAAQAIRAGDGKAFVAGGMESMTNAPYLLKQARAGYRLGHGQLFDANLLDGLWCSFEDQHMGILAEYIAERYGLTRSDLDEYSLKSHRKAVAAIKEGLFREEIVPVQVQQKKGTVTLENDEPPREDTSLEALSKLPPAFKRDGIVTAGNAPGLCDGAAAVVVMEEQEARAQGLTPLARITGYASAAQEPKWIFATPPLAIRKLLDRTGYSLSSFDLIEVNEAFASQILSNGKELDWDWERVNVNGGAIALGHPIGASGARVLVTLIYAMKHRGLQRGLASLCLGGGGAVAMSVEMV